MDTSSHTSSARSQVQYLARPGGRIAYTVQGEGPLVVAVPGMGDLRSTYRELVGPMVDAGYRVAVTDLRGHGDSDTTFREHGDVATAYDLLALIDELGGPAVILGNSMGGSAAAWAAAERPDAVAGLVGYSAILREPKATSAFSRRINRLLYRLALARPWGAAFWTNYYKGSLNKGAKAPWLDEHVAAIRSNLKEPGRLRSFRQLAMALDHSVVEARLAEITAPNLVFIGALDPDFPDIAAEVAWLNAHGARAQIVENAGHYSQAQRPDVTVPETLRFLDGLRNGSSWMARDA